MLPREHGAYGQLAFPLVTALVVAGVTVPGILIVLAAAGGFLVHEPLLVLMGRRGPRARRDDGRRAFVWLAVTGTLALCAGATAVWLAPADIRLWVLLPAVPAALLAAASAANREKTNVGEIAAAVAFSSVAVPVCLSGGTSLSVALSVAIAFAALFSTSTLAVRIVILKVRGGGDPDQVGLYRRALLLLTACVVFGPVTTASRALLPWTTLLAVAPGLLLAVGLAFRPPAPTRLRTVGWTLVSASTATALILIAALAHTP